MSLATLRSTLLNTTVIVSALGYFVDIYDLVLFSIVRMPSLRDLGVPEGELLTTGVDLLNMQMAGMLLGGLIWGILGDLRGRVSVLFGSIVLYSLANLANAFVTSTQAYGVLRFVAGIGLAGELGAAITLVSETLAKEIRGYGTSFVAGFGVSGAALASVIGQTASWRTAYIVGGVLGLALLFLRIRMFESGLFRKACEQQDGRVRRGDLRLLVNGWPRLKRYLGCILIGVPIWYVIGILVTFSPEITAELGATAPVSAANGILFTYLGLVVGDLGAGAVSQWLKSRKRVVLMFMVATTVLCAAFLTTRGATPAFYYSLCFLLGIATGYWALFVTIAAEQFGTNLRATVATTVPNFVRGSVVLVTQAFVFLKGSFGLATSALWVGATVIAIAMIALVTMRETFGRDLDFLEH